MIKKITTFSWLIFVTGLKIERIIPVQYNRKRVR